MYVIRFVTDIMHSDGEKESEKARKVKLSCMKGDGDASEKS